MFFHRSTSKNNWTDVIYQIPEWPKCIDRQRYFTLVYSQIYRDGNLFQTSYWLLWVSVVLANTSKPILIFPDGEISSQRPVDPIVKIKKPVFGLKFTQYENRKDQIMCGELNVG